jgi:ATP-dependent 26S proteasome regulatory subunit
MALARLLQPSIVVLEDADLIARSRESLPNPMQEVLLNRLLNEMDGLREDAEILFILTTNHPESLEAALTSRPGRIDQAIEFPLPDDDGRRKLVALYGRDLEVSDQVADAIVKRSEGVSPAFIKELMRRSAQFCLDSGTAPRLALADVESALDELLGDGSGLTAVLLGRTPDAPGAA